VDQEVTTPHKLTASNKGQGQKQQNNIKTIKILSSNIEYEDKE
jgi:hypothetical protein